MIITTIHSNYTTK